MKVVCAWCGKYMGEKDGNGAKGVSHGICKECLAQLKGRKGSGATKAGEKQDE